MTPKRGPGSRKTSKETFTAVGDMYQEICSWENLRFAHRRAPRGKRGREEAAAFEYNLADNLAAAQICAPEKVS